MKNNPDVYLLYEYMDKLTFAVRIKIQLDEKIDATMLAEAAREAIVRYPYFAVKVELDDKENFVLKHNDAPIVVLPEKDERLVLGSDVVNRHLFAITYRDDEIYFNFSHSICGAPGGLFWIKTTLYQYMTKRYGNIVPPKDLKTVDSAVTDGEMYFPDVESLPKEEPAYRYDGGDSNYSIERTLGFLLNPFVKNNYYYQIEIPAKELMDYAKGINGTPNTVMVALWIKTISQMYKEKKDTHLAIRIASDYREDIGAEESYRDFVRFIHVKYGWGMKNDTIAQLSLIARNAIKKQNLKELGVERFVNLQKVHDEIDMQPDLKSKKRYALSKSAFRSDPRGNCTVSYVGIVDWGEMESHIKNVYTITDGDLMIEMNALKDHFCITFQLINKSRKPLDLFCKALDGENISYKVSDRLPRYLPRIELP